MGLKKGGESPQLPWEWDMYPIAGREKEFNVIETCKCFGDTGLQASTHGGGDGRRYCDMCGSPVDDGTDEMVRAIAEHIDAFAAQVLHDYGIAPETINADPEIMGNAIEVARSILFLMRHDDEPILPQYEA